MKKAVELCKELNWTPDGDPGRYDLFKGLIEPLIKLVREDAIRETVKACDEEYNKQMELIRGKTYPKVLYIDMLYVSDKLIKEL